MESSSIESEQKFNDPNRVPITEVNQRLCQIIKEVQTTRKRKLITKQGFAVAAICPLCEVALVDDLKAHNQVQKEDQNVRCGMEEN